MRHGAAFYCICCDLRTSKTRSAWSSSNTQSGPAFLSPSPYALLKVTTVTFVSCDSFQEKFRKAYAYVYVLWTCFFPLHNTQWRSQHMQTAVYAAWNQCSSFLLQWGVLSAASCQLNASLCKALCQWRIGSPRAVLLWGLYYCDWSMGELVMQKLGPVHSWGTCLKSHPNFPAPYGIGWGLCLNCSAVQLLPQPCSASQSFLLLQGLLLRALHSQTPAHEARPQSFSWAPNLEHWSTSFFLMVA